MTLFRPSRSANHLSNYWNALVRNAPAEELARLARLVEPSEIAAIERVRAAHQRHEPDPAFVRRLERTLMNTAISPIAGTIPQPRVPLPSRNGTRDPGSASRRRASEPHLRTGWSLRPAVAIGLAILLVLASAAGIWWTTRQDEPHRMMAPIVATPVATTAVEATSGWTNFKGDSSRRGEANQGPTSQPVELWRAQANGSCTPGPAAIGDTVYAACEDGILYALDAATGEPRWTYSAELFTDGPAIADGVAYVVGESGTLYAVDLATGNELWRFATPAVHGVPATGNGLVVMAADAGTLIGIDATTGQVRWQAQVTSEGASRTPALLDGVAYVGSESGTFTAVDVTTGAIVWQVDTGDDPTGTALVADGLAIIGTSAGESAGSLSAYDATTGALVWKRDEPIFAPSITNGMGYSGSNDGTIYAFDAATGTETWRIEVGGPVRPLAVTPGILYAPSDGDQAIHAIDAATGDILWSAPVDGGIRGGVAVVDGRMYVTTTTGAIQAFGEGDSGGPVASPAPVGTPDLSPGAAPVDATPVEAGAASTPVASPAAGAIPVSVTATYAWQVGNEDGGPQRPDGVAIAPDGNIWVIDTLTANLFVYSPEGALLETISGNDIGAGPFDFSLPNGETYGAITIDRDGNVYLIDTGHYRIVRMGADRTFQTAWGSQGSGDGQFEVLNDVATGPDGTIYIMDIVQRRVQAFTPEGEFLGAIGVGEVGGPLIGVDDAGAVYVADGSRVQVFAPDGTLKRTFGEGDITFVIDVAIDQYGFTYITDGDANMVKVFAPDGTLVATIGKRGTGPGQFLGIAALAVDRDGGLYVVDFEGRQVERFDIAYDTTPVSTPVATPTT